MHSIQVCDQEATVPKKDKKLAKKKKDKKELSAQDLDKVSGGGSGYNPLNPRDKAYDPKAHHEKP